MASDAQQVMLAHSWTEDSAIDPAGYWMAEKLDGVRAYFDGTHFYSRTGNKFSAPPFFSKHLPTDQPLDGELWLGRGRFQQCISIVKNQKAARADEWKEMTYLVFDAPKLDMVYEKRLEYLKTIMPVFGQDKMSSSSPTANGGEGIMLRAPRSRYEFKRSRTLLKVKTFFDEEAIVVASVKGSGKHAHRMGHLEVKTPDGRTFSVGSGFTDAQRDKPPKAGTIITYKFQELSLKLNPRFPTFVGERFDISWTDYCKSYTPPTLKAATPAKVVSLLKQKSLIFQDGDHDDDTGSTSDRASFKNGDAEDSPESQSDSTGEDTGTSTVSSPSSSSAGTPASPGSSSSNRKRPLGQASAPSPLQQNSSSDNDNAGDSDSKQEPCRYGASCYRRNPDHLQQYSHPHKRARQ
ncbi:unnamed protein product [Mortierella alpina]